MPAGLWPSSRLQVCSFIAGGGVWVKTRASTKNIGGLEQGLLKILVVERWFYENKNEETNGGSAK